MRSTNTNQRGGPSGSPNFKKEIIMEYLVKAFWGETISAIEREMESWINENSNEYYVYNVTQSSYDGRVCVIVILRLIC